MNIKELQELSNKVRAEAAGILASTNLEKTLSHYGEVFIHGSYPLNTMYTPDIDIAVKTNDPRTSSLKALEKLVALRQFQKYEYGDFEKFPLAKRPRGFIIVLKTRVKRVKWELEIWFLKSFKEQMDNYHWIKARLTEDKRLQILKAKYQREISGQSKHQLSSGELYKKTL